MIDALIIGAGPAGLMAAEVIAQAGYSVLIADQKPSVGRKFLMAGKSGLNLTKSEAEQDFHAAFGDALLHLKPALAVFGQDDVQKWARGLGQEVFTGSTGRVFPVAMKASPLLRAWLARLEELGVRREVRWRWTGFAQDAFQFETPEGKEEITARATILALGGSSWARLGSDGTWSKILDSGIVPFEPANFGLTITWSDRMAPHFGAPLKNIALRAGSETRRGEALISRHGLEGGGIYALSRPLGNDAPLSMDLCPDLDLEQVTARLSKPRGKASLSNHLRKALRLDRAKIALLQEMAHPLPASAKDLAALVKQLPIAHDGPRPMDEAISTAGGLSFDALDASFMLRARPGVFAAGEMLDWEAPTGGYLLTACLATGRWAAQGALEHLSQGQSALT